MLFCQPPVSRGCPRSCVYNISQNATFFNCFRQVRGKYLFRSPAFRSELPFPSLFFCSSCQTTVSDSFPLKEDIGPPDTAGTRAACGRTSDANAGCPLPAPGAPFPPRGTVPRAPFFYSPARILFFYISYLLQFGWIYSIIFYISLNVSRASRAGEPYPTI